MSDETLQNKERKRKQVARINKTDHDGCWQTPHDDIAENILQRLSIGDRIRLSIACKSWRSLVMRRHIRCAPEFPWLILAQDSSKYLRFFSQCEGNIEMKLPKRDRGWFHSSSKGWLIMVKEQGLDSKLFLLNPISRARHRLPPLRTIPSFQKLVTENKSYGPPSARNWFLYEFIVLSSSNISECILAASLPSNNEVGLCRPGGKSWSVFQVLDDDIQRDSYFADTLFSRKGILYVLVKTSHGLHNDSVTARTLNFEDSALELKLVYNKEEQLGIVENQGHGGDYVMVSKGAKLSYLLESTSNEILVVDQIMDLFKSVDLDRESYTRTCDFTVYKIDSENGNILLRVQSLGNQILFLSNSGSGLSLTSSDLKGLRANAIYFQSSGVLEFSVPPLISNESGVYYLDSKTIERSSPTAGIETRGGSKLMSWFSPSL